MEPIAINHITITKKLFAEGHAATFSKRRKKMLLYCGIVFCVFGLILLAVQVRLPIASALSFPSTLSGILVVIWALNLRRSELRRKYKLFQRKNGDASARDIYCYQSYLKIETTNAEPVEIDYPEIKDHKETEHMLLLICANHTGIMLAKDGFECGSQAALLDAIEKARIEAEEAARLQGI